MRNLRVARLGSGESISTSPAPRTIRSVSRFRILADDGTTVTVRCAQNLREFRKEIQKHYTANLTYTLVRTGDAEGDSFRIQQKVVRLLNASDALQCIGYIP
jgi:3-phenylpropionate/cinnamic acid dioxygenase small subunit